MSNEYLASVYDDVDPAKAARLRDCATMLGFQVLPDGGKRLDRANFCRVRLCPICQWRRGLKTFNVTRRIIQAMGSKWQYIFITLTVRNCQGADLDNTLTHVLQSWSRFTRTKDFLSAAKGGYMRSVEVTHDVDPVITSARYRKAKAYYKTRGLQIGDNNPGYNTYHPHIHALIAVRPSYFSGKTYISQAKLADMWAAAARLDYTPSVDVERCRGSSARALAESSKYAVKVGDYIVADDWQLTTDTVALLDKVLANRRFVSYGGLMAETKRKLGLEDPDEGNLINVDEEPDKPEEGKRVWYSWATGYSQYVRDL